MDELDEVNTRRFWHELYIDFQANPLDERTEKQFCLDVKIHPTTLYNWKTRNRPEIFEAVSRRKRIYNNELRATAMKHLSRKLGKDTNALKLLFQLLGDLVERTESRVEHMSQADQIRRVNDLLKSIEEKKAIWGKGGSDGSSNKDGTNGLSGDEQKGVDVRPGGQEHPTPKDSSTSGNT